MSNNINKSDVTTQEMSQTVEDTQSKLMSTVEIAANESSNVVGDSSFKTTVNSDNTIHELMDLMERPTLIRTGKITSSNTEMSFGYDKTTFDAMGLGSVPGLITSFTFPEVLTQKNPVVADKIKQFTFIKADIKFELKINCPPNVSGCLLVVYLPLIENLPLDFSNLTVQGLTSYPSKILDYSVDTSLSMTVPYINQYDFYNRFQTNRASNPGFSPMNVPSNYAGIAIFNLQAPLSSSTADFVSYSAFSSFENVELVLPSVDPGITPGPFADADKFVAQSGTLIRRIPGADIMSDSNTSQDTKLSYNTIPPKFEAVAYDKDEMSLSYALKRENIIGKLVYNEGCDADNSSYFGKVRCFPKRNIIKGCQKKPMQMGTFDYISNLFARYTGTVKIGLRIIKTKFHYGRFAVIFDPFNRLSSVNSPSSIDSLLSTNYGMIIDLNGNDGEEGGSNYYSIEIPYMNNAGFSLIGSTTDPDVFDTTGTKNGEYLGGNDIFTAGRECYNPYLRFYAITELGYLSSAANSVPILVSISAGDDYKLSIPTVNVRLADPPFTTNEFYCESGLQITRNTKDTAHDNLSMCNGEDITSLAQLANRFTPPTVPSTKVPGHIVLSGGNNVAGRRQAQPGGVTLSLHSNTLKGFKQSNYEAIANVFRFAYGGRRYKMMATSDAFMASRLLHVPNYTGPFWKGKQTPFGVLNSTGGGSGVYNIAPASTNSTPISGEMVVENSINNFLEVERPFYSNRKLISTRQPFRPTTGAEVPCSDDVFTQFIAISKDPTDFFTIAATSPDANYIRVGPCAIRSTNETPIKPAFDNASFETDVSLQTKLIYEPTDVSFTERDFLIDEDYPGSDTLQVSTIVTGEVYEALGTGAGLTFLQAPPCVIFG